MRFLVLGAGATGGYFGGRLANAGGDVTFLVRGARAEQLAQDGLIVASPFGDIQRRVQAVTREDLTATYDVVVLTCKAYHLDDAVSAIAPAMGSGTRILPLLNGFKHLDRLDDTFGRERVLGGLCAISAVLTPEGHVQHLNRVHTLVFGERDGSRPPFVVDLERELRQGGFDARLSPIILQEMWEKFVMLTTLASMTCLMRASVGDIVETSEGASLMAEMLDECTAIAGASGHSLRPDVLDRTRAMLTEPGSSLAASMLRDVERGGPTEADHIVGDMLARAKPFGLSAPLLRVAFCHLQACEARRRSTAAALAQDA